MSFGNLDRPFDPFGVGYLQVYHEFSYSISFILSTGFWPRLSVMIPFRYPFKPLPYFHDSLFTITIHDSPSETSDDHSLLTPPKSSLLHHLLTIHHLLPPKFRDCLLPLPTATAYCSPFSSPHLNVCNSIPDNSSTLSTTVDASSSIVLGLL